MRRNGTSTSTPGRPSLVNMGEREPVVGPSGPAGWFADPSDATSYRWWDGKQWTAFTAPVRRSVSRRWAVVATVSVLLVLFAGWALIWILLFPALMLNDADNGKFGHDVTTLWLPQVGLGVLGIGACVSTLVIEGRQRWPIWQVLLPPGLAVVGAAGISTALIRSR